MTVVTKRMLWIGRRGTGTIFNKPHEQRICQRQVPAVDRLRSQRTGPCGRRCRRVHVTEPQWPYVCYSVITSASGRGVDLLDDLRTSVLPTLEDEVIGVWRDLSESDGLTSLLRIAWYRDLAHWQETRRVLL